MKKQQTKARDVAKKQLYAAIFTALFVAMAVSVKSITKVPIPILGAGGMQISFGGIFTFFPAILFGPVWGGLASALCDIIGHFVNPTGAYIPYLSLTAFAGGFIKGLVWKLVTKKREKALGAPVKAVLAGVFAVIFVLGCVFTGVLMSDGVITSAVSTKETVPFRYQIEAKELSPLSSVAVGLAQYNKDTLTLTGAKADGNGLAILPTAVSTDGVQIKITKLNASVLNTEGAKYIVIPKNYTALASAESFALKNEDLTVYAEKPFKALAELCEEKGITLVEGTPAEIDGVAYNYQFPEVEGELGATVSDGIFKVKFSDTYRKYLSGYINFLTIGLILVGALGLAFLAVGIVLSLLAKTGKGWGSRYICVLVAVLVSGVFVTTVNTWILMACVANYAGRYFWVLYLPRIAEELFVSVAQAYLITLLLTALSSHKIFNRYFGLSLLPSAKKEEKPEEQAKE